MTVKADPPDGILVIDKPPGMTSHDVVSRIRKRLNVKRVGHGGTLDPEATGVLVIGVGRATRLLTYAQDAPKSYVASGRLGVTTSTQDASGEVVSRDEVSVEAGDVKSAAERLVGEIDQIPPMVSAVKVGGERLYKKARRGEEIEREARRVTVYELDMTSFDAPDFTIAVRCSAGTYVRTLIHDIGASLGCGAHLTSLRRVASGGFEDKDAIPIEEVSEGSLRPALDIVANMPRIDLSADAAELVRNGRALPQPAEAIAGEVALVESGRLLAIYRGKDDRLVAEKVVAQ